MTHPRRSFVLSLVLLAVLAIAADAATTGTSRIGTTVPARGAPQTTLAFKFEAGDELVFEQSMRQKIEMEGMPSMGGTEIISTMRWRVLEVADNGEATIEVLTERVHGTIATSMGATSFDSAGDEEPTDPTMRILVAQTGVAFRMVLTPSGKVVRIENADEMRQMVVDAMPEDQRRMASSMVETMLTDDAMESMLGQSFQAFPDEPVGPGDSWDRSMSMKVPMIGTLVTSMTMTFDRIEERDGSTIAVIAWNGTMDIVPEEGGTFPGTFDLTDAVMTGTSEFDVDRGQVLANTMSGVMQMAVGVGGQEMYMDVTMNVDFELLEGGD